MTARTLLRLAAAVFLWLCAPSVSAQTADHESSEAQSQSSVKTIENLLPLDSQMKANGVRPPLHGAVRTYLESSRFGVGSSESPLSKSSEKHVVGGAVDVRKNHQGLILLTPGTSASLPSHPPQIAQDSVSVNGQSPRSNMTMVDGVSANFGIAAGGESPGASAAGTSPAFTAIGGTSGLISAEATQEVAIHGYNIEPQYRRIPGAQVDFISRAGTNQFHGSLFEYFGHDVMDANDWFANNRGLERQKRRLNDFGGTIGGPVKRDHTFFYFSYEGVRLSQPAVLLSDVPSLNARRAAPAEIRPLLDAYSIPNGADRTDGFAELTSSFSNPAGVDAWSVRLDHRIGDNLMLNSRYATSDSTAEERGTGGLSANSIGTLRARSHTFTGSAAYVINPYIVTEGRANYSFLSFGSSYVLDDFAGAIVPSEKPLSNNFVSGIDESFRFNLDGRNTTLFSGSEARHRQRQINLVWSISAVPGTHTLKFGVDYRRMAPSLGLRRLESDVLFDGVSQALSGNVSRFSLLERTSGQRPVFHNLSIYGQDMWRVRSRFSLTYGVRWELNPAPASGAIEVAQIEDLATIHPGQAGRRLWGTTYGNLGPRMGASAGLIDIDGRELVARGGLGIFYDFGSEQAGNVYVDSFPFVTVASVRNTPLASVLNATSGTGDFSRPGVGPFYAFDPKINLPYTMQWNASLEQALGRNQTFSVAYVGSAGRRLLVTETHFDANQNLPFIRLIKNGGKSDYHSLQTQFNHRLSSGIQALVGYTLSKLLDDVTDDSTAHVQIRSREPLRERAPSAFDTRHSLIALASYRLPEPYDYGVGHSLLRNWTVDALFQARSSRPVNVLYAVPTSYGFAYLRPDVLNSVPLYLSDETTAGGKRINPAAFSVPSRDVQGSLGRNSLRGFPLHQLDFSLRRKFSFTDSFGVQFRADVFNLTNHPNFEDPSGSSAILGGRFSDVFRTNPTFGSSHSMQGRGQTGGPSSSFNSFYAPGGSRTVQLSVRVEF